jgi:hypothetical protein
VGTTSIVETGSSITVPAPSTPSPSLTRMTSGTRTVVP